MNFLIWLVPILLSIGVFFLAQRKDREMNEQFPHYRTENTTVNLLIAVLFGVLLLSVIAIYLAYSQT